MRTLTYDDYTVGWICALPLELTASMTMLEEEDTMLPRDPHDNNIYTLGRIGRHNVVMGCLPAGKLGTSPAATVAVQMRLRFRSIRFGFLVGIGGGIPSSLSDIRLGDVVVSKPGNRGGGVVQYDYGKTTGEGKFMRTGSLNAPAEVLLSALSNLQARHMRNRDGLRDRLFAATTNNPEFANLGPENDMLFESGYPHQGGQSCEGCSSERLVIRLPRDATVPMIHYGLIASGNSIMMDATSRDKLGQETGALCFEMEAAGLMSTFPSIVIRGICDYSDSHKNNRWQRYAALTAAVYAKELLGVIPPDQVNSTPVAMPSPPPIPTQETGSVAPPTSFRRTRKVKAPPTRSTTEQSKLSAHSVFSRYILFPPNTVALGRLVADRLFPEHDYCPIPFDLDPDEFSTSHQPKLREIVENARRSELLHRFVRLFSSLKVHEEFPILQETTYTLLNSGQVFMRLCSNVKIREWLEREIKVFGSPVYMVTAIHTIQEASLHGSSTAESGSTDTHSTGVPPRGEVVFGVKYRKVQFKLFPGEQQENAYLPTGSNRWQVISLGTRPDKKNDIVEASLMEFLTAEDFLGREVHPMGDELLVLDFSRSFESHTSSVVGYILSISLRCVGGPDNLSQIRFYFCQRCERGLEGKAATMENM